jgi:hypothetical protein
LGQIWVKGVLAEFLMVALSGASVPDALDSTGFTPQTITDSPQTLHRLPKAIVFFVPPPKPTQGTTSGTQKPKENITPSNLGCH